MFTALSSYTNTKPRINNLMLHLKTLEKEQKTSIRRQEEIIKITETEMKKGCKQLIKWKSVLWKVAKPLPKEREDLNNKIRDVKEVLKQIVKKFRES